jgi:hypothetical protein
VPQPEKQSLSARGGGEAVYACVSNATHLFFHSGFRFSMNARKPSFASSVFINSFK